MNKMMERTDFLKRENFFKKLFLFLPTFFLLSCSGSFKSLSNQIQKKLKRSSAFVCEEFTKGLFQKNLPEEKLVKGLEGCLKEGKIRKALLVLERLLESDRERGKIREWEKKAAELSFYQLKDYEKALKYYNLLLKKPLKPGEKFFIQYHIAESFFYLQKYSQAQREVEKCFSKGLSLKNRKKAWALKARIFMAKKDFESAIELFQDQIQKFPSEEKFFREYLALIYESRKDFFSAIAELEKIKAEDSFIKEKIHRLRERQNNQPGF